MFAPHINKIIKDLSEATGLPDHEIKIALHELHQKLVARDILVQIATGKSDLVKTRPTRSRKKPQTD